LAQDPEWLAATTLASQKKAKDPEWLAANLKGQQKKKARLDDLKQQGRIKEYRALLGVKDQHTEETKLQMSASASARWAKTMPKVHAENTVFDNIYVAAEALGIHKDTVVYRIRAQSLRWKDWYFIE